MKFLGVSAVFLGGQRKNRKNSRKNLTISSRRITLDLRAVMIARKKKRKKNMESIVVSDIIEFEEAVFTGSFKKPTFLGKRKNRVQIVKDSYGEKTQQHTFTVVVIESTGLNPLSVGVKTTRKGRNLYSSARLIEHVGSDRAAMLVEKHARGASARARKSARLAGESGWMPA